VWIVARGLVRLAGRFGVEEAVAFLSQLVEEAKLGFEEVDMVYFVRDQVIEKRAGDEIADAVAVVAGLNIERPGVMFGGEVGFQRFAQGLADPQGVKLLQVRVTVEEDDPGDQVVGVVRLLGQFGAGPVGVMVDAQSSCSRKCGQYWLTAVSSDRRAASR
jgi:hypothetical protein